MTANEFNEWYPVGTAVILTDDFGAEHHTNTRSIAWNLGCGESVVKVLGRASGYALDRIRVLESHQSTRANPFRHNGATQ